MSLIEYNVTVELDTDQPAESFADSLPDVHSMVLHVSEWGRPALTMTLVGSLAGAIATGLSIVQQVVDVSPYSVEALPTEEFDRRTDVIAQPAMLSVPQAADMLGISEQRVRQLVTAGRLVGSKTGREWLVTLASVQDRIARLSNP